jgi:glycosyltransferase involved in cell wall biosynthesis
MAQGKPIVATRGGGVPEIVIDGVTGLLVSMNDAQAMAHAIVSLLQDSELGKQMGRQGRSRVERTFTLEQTARGIESIYRRLLKRDPLQTAVVIDDYGTNDRTGSDGLGSIL